MSEDEEDGPLPRVLSALLGLELYLDGLLDALEPVLLAVAGGGSRRS